MKHITAAALALPFLCLGQQLARADDAEAMYKNVDAKAAKELVADASKKIAVLDVRTPDEFKAGHLAGAKLVDFKAADFDTELAKLDKTKTYLLHCRSGRRSTAAFDKMKSLGFKSVYHLDGGILAWEAAGGKVEK